MQKLMVFTALFGLVLAVNLPTPKPEHLPRETKWDVKSPGVGYVQHRETFYNQGPHLVDGTAQVSKNFAANNDPIRTLGKIEYNHLPSQSAFNVQAENAGRLGTNVKAEGLYHLYKDRHSAVDLGANYGQQFGGPFGRSQPNVNAFIRGYF